MRAGTMRGRGRRPRAAAAVAALLALLAGASLDGAAQGGAAEADAPLREALLPLDVALRALPAALASAIAEAEDHLLADVAQRRLDETHAYVQGFAALPAGEAALQDPRLREAYAWTEEAVEAFLALPSSLARSEEAGANCEAYGAQQPEPDARRHVREGLASLRTTQSVQHELRSLLQRQPSLVDPAPVRQSVDLLAAWLVEDAAPIETCLLELAELLGLETEFLHAVVVPATIHRTGRLRLFGSVGGFDRVRVESPGLSWSIALPAANGSFQATHVVPRDAGLGNHTVRLTAGPLAHEVNVTVERAAVALVLDAPRQATAGSTFPVVATLSAVPGTEEIDRGELRIAWRGDTQRVPLRDGVAALRLPARDVGDEPESFPLVATYSGTGVLADAEAELAVEVRPLVTVPEPADEEGTASPAERLREALDRGIGPGGLPGWAWLLLALAAALALLGLVRVSRPGAPQDLMAFQQAGGFPGAASFAVAMGLLFQALRGLGLVPEGRTVREWLDGHRRPSAVADAFERIRYGRHPEEPPLRRMGVDWVRRTWRRWLGGQG